MTSETPGIIPVLENTSGIRAFFTTRQGGFSQGAFAFLNLSYASGDHPETVRRNWERVLRSQGLEGKTLALPRLCHGIRIAEISGAGDVPENIDAIFTRDAHWMLAVTMGDCLAALIADPETRCVAAVHAGWRGSRDNILGLTLEHLFSAGHCRPDSTWLALGPCLSMEQLELSGEIIRTLPPDHVVQKHDRFFFDLRGCNRAQAIAAGTLPDHISVNEACTRLDAEHFFSYRRDGAASGRMAACISLV